MKWVHVLAFFRVFSLRNIKAAITDNRDNNTDHYLSFSTLRGTLRALKFLNKKRNIIFTSLNIDPTKNHHPSDLHKNRQIIHKMCSYVDAIQTTKQRKPLLTLSNKTFYLLNFIGFY